MPLFHWKSELLENWRLGDIIVSAESPAEAREIARKHLPQMLQQRGYDNDGAYTESKIALFESDIAAEPEVIACNCYWETGSE